MQHLSLKRQTFYLILLMGWVSLSSPQVLAATSSASPSASYQDMGKVKTLLRSFLIEQAMGSPDKATVTIGDIDPALKLPVCAEVKAFMPTGSRAWGKTSVGARCDGPQPWTIYVQASVIVQSRYLVASNPLPQGRIITAADIQFENGDLSQLPLSILTDISQVLGKTVLLSLPAGTILKQEMLKSQVIIQQGQKVSVSSSGAGFSVSSEGVAINSAAEGQIVQVRLPNKRIISGIAQAGGVVIVKF